MTSVKHIVTVNAKKSQFSDQIRNSTTKRIFDGFQFPEETVKLKNGVPQVLLTNFNRDKNDNMNVMYHRNRQRVPGSFCNAKSHDSEL